MLRGFSTAVCRFCKEEKLCESVTEAGICLSCRLFWQYFQSNPKLLACRSRKNAYLILVRRRNGQRLCCDICGEEPVDRSLSVDHHHQTMMVRGLLCARCNISLSSIDKTPNWLDLAKEYLSRNSGIKLGWIELKDVPCEDDGIS